MIIPWEQGLRIMRGECEIFEWSEMNIGPAFRIKANSRTRICRDSVVWAVCYGFMVLQINQA